MAIFGGRSARRRLRHASRDALAIPAFSAAVDCSAWVLDGLWPAELATITPQTAQLADYLNADLQRIARSANDKLQAIVRSGLSGPARQAAEGRVIHVARAFAVLRVESTVRQLNNYDAAEQTNAPLLPAVPALPSVLHLSERKRSVDPVGPEVDETSDMRLQRLLAFVVRQDPGLAWAIADRADGTMVLVTDIADGWIPPGIELPAGVHLLAPARRAATAAAMLGAADRCVQYSPGDRLGWADDFGSTATSIQPRELDVIDNLGWVLSEATQSRAGLPALAIALARAGAAETGIRDAEIDLLRVHLDTARYQMMAHYPASDVTMVLNCMLLAATEAMLTGDMVSANYHLSWFQVMN